MTQLNDSLRDIFDDHSKQDTLLQTLSQLDSCHSQMHEFSEPVEDCHHKIAKLNKTCSRFVKPFLHVVYIDSATSGGRVVSAAPFITDRLKSACYIESDLLEPTLALDKLIRENMCGNKQVVPNIDTPQWNKIKDDFDTMQHTIHKHLRRVVESAQMAVEDFTPSQLDNLERDLKHNISSCKERMAPTWNKQLDLRLQLSAGGTIEEVANEMLGELEERSYDSIFIDYYKAKQRTYKELACFMRQHIEEGNDEAANEFVTYLAYLSFLDEIRVNPTQSLLSQRDLGGSVIRLVKSGLWKRAQQERGLGLVVALAGCQLFDRDLLKRYGVSGFSVSQWIGYLRLNYKVKDLDVRQVNQILRPYRDSIGKKDFAPLMQDYPDLWNEISQIIDRR